MTYAEKLKDPRWQKRRLKTMERDNWCCVRCGNDKETLHVHHKAYSGEPWDAPDDTLETLCQTCHEMKHAEIPFKPWAEIAQQIGQEHPLMEPAIMAAGVLWDHEEQTVLWFSELNPLFAIALARHLTILLEEANREIMIMFVTRDVIVQGTMELEQVLERHIQAYNDGKRSIEKKKA